MLLRSEISRGYKEDGYYPEAFINLLALLGWNPGTEQEIFSLDELVEAFSLDRVVKSGAKFNPDKAKWFNQEYLRKQTNSQLAEQFKPFLLENNISCNDDKYIEQICGLIKERAHFVNEFWGLSNYFFEAPKSYSAENVKKFWNQDTKDILSQIIVLLDGLNFNNYNGEYNKEEVTLIEQSLASFIKDNSLKMGVIMNTLRITLVGETKGVGIADIIWYIGKEESIERIQNAIKTIEI